MNLFCLDLDGTLEDSRHDMVAAARRVRESFELAPRADDDLRPHVHRGMAHLYAQCFDELDDTDAVRRAYEAEYSSHIADRTRLYDGVEQALVELSEMGLLACVTNKPEALSVRLLEALAIDHRFAAVIGGDTCAAGKPDPVMLRAAQERSGFADGPADRCFMIGDTPGDVRLGKAHGATTVWCAWGYKQSPAPESPDLVAATPSKLAGVLRAAL